jgi:hypothetical protein
MDDWDDKAARAIAEQAGIAELMGDRMAIISGQ